MLRVREKAVLSPRRHRDCLRSASVLSLPAGLPGIKMVLTSLSCDKLAVFRHFYSLCV
jgi:hypothetical protein